MKNKRVSFSDRYFENGGVNVAAHTSHIFLGGAPPSPNHTTHAARQVHRYADKYAGTDARTIKKYKAFPPLCGGGIKISSLARVPNILT